MLQPYAGSEQWCLDPEAGHIVFPVDKNDLTKGAKFFEVLPHPVQGNPLIVQPTSGSVFLTVVGGEILCEAETVYDANLRPFAQMRVTRRSLDNPEQLEYPNPIFLGEIYANSQRIAGEPERLYFVRLNGNPDRSRYSLHSVREVLSWRDGIGLAAIAKALERGLLTL